MAGLYAVLDAYGVVINIAEADASWSPGTGLTKREAAAETQIGGRWAGSAWEAPLVVVPAPQTITPLQARRAIRAAGLLSAVNAFIAEQPEEVQEAWEYCVEVRRDDALIAAAQVALGLTSEQVDDLFRAAVA